MDKVNFDYSLKNIPIPDQNNYLKSLIDKTQKFFQRIRWKVYWIDKEKNDDIQKEKYGFKTEKCAPQHHELVKFENDIMNIIQNIEYRPEKTKFQKQLLQDVKNIKKSDKVLLPADKTSNLYEIDKKDYNKLLINNITSTYKIADEDLEDKINKEAKKITDNLDISQRVEYMAHSEAIITLKDHKPNFENRPQCRLINPAKSNIGKISKLELQKINTAIRDKSKLKQWRSTSETLKWFKNIENKKELEFLQLDIVNFYPSITEKLFKSAIKFAQSMTTITETNLEIINNARKSLLFHDGRTWQKKGNLFDVTMGAYDGAEMCELVGLYILHNMRNKFPELNFGLYRDDGLATLKSTRKTKTEQKKKAIIKMFKEMNLEITIDTGLHRVNFLDVTLHINGTFWPYAKPNSEVKYVNVQSNHPQHVLKQIPNSVNKRLSTISCDKEHFDKAKITYENALRNSGHVPNLKYEQTKEKKKRTRNRKIIWYNPPYNACVKTNIGKEFLKALDRNFPKKHPFNKYLNRSNIKISYSCTTNMASIIAGHNKKILRVNENETKQKGCNCKKGVRTCPLKGNCKIESIIYKAEVKINDTNKNYIGLTKGDFKTRYRNHKNSFKNPNKRNETVLSNTIWDNNLNPTPIVKWTAICQAKSYTPGNRKCDLCISEKIHILKASRDKHNLNKRSEVASICVHRNAYKLARIKS